LLRLAPAQASPPTGAGGISVGMNDDWVSSQILTPDVQDVNNAFIRIHRSDAAAPQ
jgi:hypothetical protein